MTAPLLAALALVLTAAPAPGPPPGDTPAAELPRAAGEDDDVIDHLDLLDRLELLESLELLDDAADDSENRDRR